MSGWTRTHAHTIHTHILYSFAPSSQKHKFHMNVDHHWPVVTVAHPLTVGLQVGVWKALRQSLPVPKSVGRALKKARPFNTNWTCEQLNGDSVLFFREFHRIPGSIWLCGCLWFDVLMIGIYIYIFSVLGIWVGGRMISSRIKIRNLISLGRLKFGLPSWKLTRNPRNGSGI